MAATRVTPIGNGHLRTLLNEVGEHTPLDDLVDHDVGFHRFITELSGNDCLASLLEGLCNNTSRAGLARPRPGTLHRTPPRGALRHRRCACRR
ncbi:MAG: FCD domain-containing protein [Lacisediminihabitans sp.]